MTPVDVLPSEASDRFHVGLEFDRPLRDDAVAQEHCDGEHTANHPRHLTSLRFGKRGWIRRSRSWTSAQRTEHASDRRQFGVIRTSTTRKFTGSCAVTVDIFPSSASRTSG
jgi:hypothetical protein